MVGTSPALLRIVAYARALDMPAIDHDHGGVDVEDQTGALARPVEESLSEQFVEPCELADVRWRQPLQESSDRGFVRKAIQAYDFLEGPIVLEDLRLVDAVHACDDRVENRQDHIGGLEVAEARARPEMALQEAAQAQLLTKTLDQEHAGEVRQVRFLEGEWHLSQCFRHWTHFHLLGEFVSIAYSTLSSEYSSTEEPLSLCSLFNQIAHH